MVPNHSLRNITDLITSKTCKNTKRINFYNINDDLDFIGGASPKIE